MSNSEQPTFNTELQTAHVVHSGGGNVNYFVGGSFAPQATVPVNGSNLPHPHPHFVGREEELGKVFEALRSRAWIVTIDGMGGIGKTTLALEVAHRCKSGVLQNDGSPRFERFIWASARDKSHYTLDDLIDSVLSVLGPVSLGTPTPDPANKAALAIRLLSGSTCLLIVDNLETVTDEPLHRFLRDLPSPSKVIVTSRHHIQTGERVVTVGGLEEHDAVELLKHEASRLQIGLAEADHQQLKIIARKTYGIPLVLRWVMESVYNGKSLEWVLTALQAATAKDVFDYIYRLSLSTLDDATRQVFRSLAIFPGWTDLNSISAVNPEHNSVEERVSTLVTRSLVEDNRVLVQSSRRFRLHPFTRYLAVQELASTADKGEGVVTLALEYYNTRIRDWTEGFIAGEWVNIEHVSRLAVRSERADLFEQVVRVARLVSLSEPDKSDQLVADAIQVSVQSGRTDLKFMLLRDIGHRYVYGYPVIPPSFVGREKLLRTIRNTFEGRHRSHSLISLIGPRRIGKTSILRTLASCEQDSCVYVPIGLQTLVGGNGLAQQFSFEIRSSVQSSMYSIGIKSEVPYPDRSSSDHEALLSLKRYIDTARESIGAKRIVLMFDELDVFQLFITEERDDTVFRILQFLRFMVQEGSVGIIATGFQPPSEWPDQGQVSPLFNIGIILRVSTFDYKEACELLQRPLQGLVEFDPQALRYLYEMTGGFPFLLQLLGSRVTDICIEREVLRIDRATAEHAVAQILDDSDHFFHPLFRLEPHALEVVRTAANMCDEFLDTFTAAQVAEKLHGAGHITHDLDLVVQSLVASGIFKAASGNRYAFGMGLFPAYLKRDGLSN